MKLLGPQTVVSRRFDSDAEEWLYYLRETRDDWPEGMLRLAKMTSNRRRNSLRRNASRTFKQAQAEILDVLQGKGWRLSLRSLKIPHATSPDGWLRLWFKPQAIYYTAGSHNFGDARSLHEDDIRTQAPQAVAERSIALATKWGDRSNR